MKRIRTVLLLLAVFLLYCPGNVHAQNPAPVAADSTGAYCNVFYVTSDNAAILPFAEQCFIADQYSIKDPTNFRAIGPVDGAISLFDRFDWLLHFYLPIPKENDRLQVAMPADLYSKALKMNSGTMFITLADNRSSSRFDPPLDNVDFAAVSGSAKVLEFVPQGEGMPYPNYKLQMDVRFRQVDRTGASPKFIGDPIRVKMVVVIEPKM
jgi:hypothetical protein